MSTVLADLTAQYSRTLTYPAQVTVSPQEPQTPRRVTRTYTGAALERRRAWGRSWGARVSQAAQELRAKGE